MSLALKSLTVVNLLKTTSITQLISFSVSYRLSLVANLCIIPRLKSVTLISSLPLLGLTEPTTRLDNRKEQKNASL